jgi:methionyl-tRNA formyltransferase
MQIQFLGDRGQHFIPCLQKMGHEIQSISKQEEIGECDLCLVSGYRKIIKPPYIKKPKKGIVAFHESDLPKGRGWACLNWTLIEKVPLTVSMFFIDEGVDTGGIIAKKTAQVEAIDTVSTLRKKANDLILKMLEEYLPQIENGTVRLLQQNGEPTYWPKRSPEDAEWKGPDLEKLWDHLRVCDNEQYPAFFKVHGRKIILRYEVES